MGQRREVSCGQECFVPEAIPQDVARLGRCGDGNQSICYRAYRECAREHYLGYPATPDCGAGRSIPCRDISSGVLVTAEAPVVGSYESIFESMTIKDSTTCLTQRSIVPMDVVSPSRAFGPSTSRITDADRKSTRLNSSHI